MQHTHDQETDLVQRLTTDLLCSYLNQHHLCVAVSHPQEQQRAGGECGVGADGHHKHHQLREANWQLLPLLGYHPCTHNCHAQEPTGLEHCGW